MKKLYLITGGSGHLGSVLVNKLLENNENIRCLLLENEMNKVSDKVDKYIGDIRDKNSLLDFFNVQGYDETILIHGAAKVTILSKEDPSVYETNVIGTKNILELALENKINRVIYISSVHALKELPNNQTIVETKDFSSQNIEGQYAKSKAEAARIALEYAEKGLNLSIVHPSGIIGPGDKYHTNNSVNTIKSMQKGTIPCSIDGAYDFVDVRDVVDGILSCIEKGRSGECYILSGYFITVKDLLNEIRRMKNKKENNIQVPYSIAKLIAPLSEWFYLKILKEKPLLTPYSIYTLKSNANFSNQKAKEELDFKTRDIKESIKDSLIE